MFEGLRFHHWRTELGSDGILVVSFDREGESANSFARAALEELQRLIERIALEPPRGVIVRSAKPGSFVVGADLREFGEYAARGEVAEALARGHRAFDALAGLPCPTVAAIHGACMGGGTELSLACRYRVASNDAKTRIGLPEIMLGIVPGWGGTARLPALVGAPKAMDMILTGRALKASAAKTMGLVDDVVDEAQLLNRARQLIALTPQRPLAQRLTAAATSWWPVRQVLAMVMRKQVAARADQRHYPAPYAAIDQYRKFGGSLRSMLRAEPRIVAKLAATATARNLVRVYFLQDGLKSLGSKVDHAIKRVHVVGAGVMGGDIAAWCALQGFEVSLQDRELKFVTPALERARELFARRAGSAARAQEATARLRADVEGAAVPEADLVIEAIFENADAKKALYASLEPRMKPEALLASNTSSIALASLSAGLTRPAQFLGLHYFNPVAQMPLVEIVRHPGLTAEALKRAQGFVRSIDKLPLPVGPTPGFLVNRILMPYLFEAMLAYSEGVPGPVIDRAAKQFGMPMGPIELADTVGLDVAASVGKILIEFLGLEQPKGLEALLASGKRGRKDGQGFYTWVEGRAQKPAVPKDYVPPADLGDRLILPLINEAVACLTDGVVDTEEQLDAGVIFGTGFAPFRGGPCQYIRDEGANKLRGKLEQFAARYGKRFAPKSGWERFA
jgi:3-hydroxyacyl-CoA dehydrogenase/enoyl-CoA hydratase/3-hydroxybutyryl-CoA epimerase